MSRIATISTGWSTLTSDVPATTGDNGFTPLTRWLPCGDLVEARCPFHLRNLTGAIEVIPAAQLADHERATATDVQFGSTWTGTEGVVDPTDFTDLSTKTDDNQIVRFGFITRNSGSATGLGTVEVDATFEMVRRVRSPDLDIDWSLVCANSTTATFFPATSWVDPRTAVRFRAVLELQGRTGNLQVFAGFQTADDPTNPDSAISMGTSATADGVAWPTSFTKPTTLGGKRWIRFGWTARVTSGSSLSWGMVRGRFERLQE